MDLPDYAIEAKGLFKTYAATKTTPEMQALKGIDLAIPRGSIFGLLGPNGAGKSTFINILSGLCRKTSGSVSIWGRDIDERPRDARAAIGVVPQEIAADPFFTPFEALEVAAGMYAVPKSERRTMELLTALGLADKSKAYVRQLSGGMKRRLMVAKAMVHNPPVLILDEPTAGVDVELRRQLWAYVVELNRKGVTVVLTTHYLQEAQELCDTIAIINNGMVAACEPTPTLLGRMDRIGHIPAEIVQGRYDMVCPACSAFELAAAWPNARLSVVPDAGHSALEPGIRRALVAAVERFRQER